MTQLKQTRPAGRAALAVTITTLVLSACAGSIYETQSVYTDCLERASRSSDCWREREAFNAAVRASGDGTIIIAPRERSIAPAPRNDVTWGR